MDTFMDASTDAFRGTRPLGSAAPHPGHSPLLGDRGAVRAAVRALLDWDPTLQGTEVWDPACADGTLAKALAAQGCIVHASDTQIEEERAEVERAEGERDQSADGFASARDFLVVGPILWIGL